MDISSQEFLEISFLDYYSKIVKKNNKNNDNTPINLIRTYFLYMEHMPFEKIADNYRRKYVLNENKLESVHKQSEREGLRLVFDYVLSDEWKNFSNIYVILKIHSLLYSKVPHPEFGGKFRSANACIAESDIKTSDYSNITSDIAALYPIYDQLLKDSKTILENKDKQDELLFPYINRAIELKCRLVEIHPFADGNGRTCRALLNILFRSIGLPPIYVKNSEKEEYINAMDLAIRNKDLSKIKRFYYYKICDSIYDLDLSERKIKGISLGETSRNYKEKIAIMKKLNNIFNKINIDFTLEEAIVFLENDSKLNLSLERLFDGKLFRSDLKIVNSTLLHTLINIYADIHNYTIFDDPIKFQYSHISSALSIYYNDIQDLDLLSKNKEKKLIEEYKLTKNQNIKNIIINSYQKLITFICNLYVNNQIELEDYIQEANLILLSSIDSYNIDSQYSFKTYIAYKIRTSFDSKLTNKHSNNITNYTDKKHLELNDIAAQNALSIIHGLLDEDEYSVAIRMFGFVSDNHPLSDEHIANQLNKQLSEVEQIKEKVLTKISSDKVKNSLLKK